MFLQFKKLLGITTIISVIGLQMACSSKEETASLNTRVEDGLVVLGSDPVIDDAYRVQKEVAFITRNNVMQSTQKISYDEDSYELDQPYAKSTGSKKSKSAGTFGQDYTFSSTYKSQLNDKIAQVNAKLLTGLPFDNKGTLNKAKISKDDLNRLMDSYSADIYKNASESNLRYLYSIAVGALQGKLAYQEKLADFYLDGYTNDDYAQLAASWYILAANNGSNYAKYMLSVLYQIGYGVPEDLAESVAWYDHASEAPSAAADKIRVAKRYSTPTSIIHDPKLAFKWMHSAAEGGNSEAQYLLGDMYLQGNGVDKSEMEAITWYGKAAERMSPYAQYSLGVMYYNGQGTEQNLLEAHKWLEMAALQGHTEAQYLLGRMYEQGFGVEKNLPKAYAWWKQIPAGNIVVDNFDQKLTLIIADMLPADRKEAQRLVTEYKSRVKV